MDRYLFAVRDAVFCLWGYDLREENEIFLRTFDPGYFEYAAHRHLEQLEGDNSARAALTLRATYHHGLEALFSLLGALSQAPGAVAAWLPKCSTPVLRELVRDISEQRPILTQRGRQALSWQLLSEIVHSRVWVDEKPERATAQRYGKLWSHFASDFLNELHTHEYNSIKHGFRAASGGSVLRIGLEHSYAVPPPESEMETVGASPHGSAFAVPEPIPASSGKSPHLTLRRKQLNWRAEAMAQALQLVSWSLNNVVGFLRILNGIPPNQLRFHRPEASEFFEAPWNWQVGVLSGSFNYVLDEREVVHASPDELRAELEARAGAA